MKLSDVSSSSAGVCCWRTQVRLLSWSWRKLLLVLAELKLLIWAACRGRTSASNGGEMEQKRASWREAVFFQSDSVAVKFRAWIFNQDGFPVRDFFSFLFFFSGFSPYITNTTLLFARHSQSAATTYLLDLHLELYTRCDCLQVHWVRVQLSGFLSLSVSPCGL